MTRIFDLQNDLLAEEVAEKKRKRGSSYFVDEERNVSSVSNEQSQSSCTVATVKPKKIKKDLHGFIDRIDQTGMDDLNKELFKLLISQKENFEKTLKNPFFVNFANKLRPSYALPSIDEMITIYHDEYNQMKSQDLTIDKSWLLKVIECHSGLHLAIAQNEEKAKKFVAASSDICDADNFNTFLKSSLIKLSENQQVDSKIEFIISNSKFSGKSVEKIPILRCFSYYFLKLLNMMVETSFYDNIKLIVSHFQQACIETSLIEKGGIKIPFFEPSNFENIVAVLNSIKQNLPLMKTMMTDVNLIFDADIIHLLLINKTFVNYFNDLLVTINILNDKFCRIKENNNLASAIHEWIELKKDIKDEVFLNEYKKLDNEVLNETRLISYYLHPSYRGSNLEFIDQEYTKLMHVQFLYLFEEENITKVFHEYKYSQGIFSKLISKNYKDSNTFWKAVISIYPEFTNICKKYCQIPDICEPIIQDENSTAFYEKEQSKIEEMYYYYKVSL